MVRVGIRRKLSQRIQTGARITIRDGGFKPKMVCFGNRIILGETFHFTMAAGLEPRYGWLWVPDYTWARPGFVGGMRKRTDVLVGRRCLGAVWIDGGWRSRSCRTLVSISAWRIFRVRGSRSLPRALLSVPSGDAFHVRRESYRILWKNRLRNDSKDEHGRVNEVGASRRKLTRYKLNGTFTERHPKENPTKQPLKSH